MNILHLARLHPYARDSLLQSGYWHVTDADGLAVCARGSNADVAAAATITDLQQASKALQGKGGLDPFPAAMQVPPVPHVGPFPLSPVHRHAGSLRMLSCQLLHGASSALLTEALVVSSC